MLKREASYVKHGSMVGTGPLEQGRRLVRKLSSHLLRAEETKAMYAALRLWTSDTRLRTTHGEMAFYELLNRTLREDSEPMMAHAAVITRALAMFCCKHGSGKHAESRDRRGAWMLASPHAHMHTHAYTCMQARCMDARQPACASVSHGRPIDDHLMTI